MHVSGYNEELKTFADAHIPIFFSQYGSTLGTCGQRIFQETTAIYSPAMTRVFSGGIAYEFYDSPATRTGYWGNGLVKEERAAVGKGLTKLPDFHSLDVRLHGVKVAAVEEELKAETGAERREREIPPLSSHWHAGYPIPFTATDWNRVRRSLEEKVWLDVGEAAGTDTKLVQRPGPGAVRA